MLMPPLIQKWNQLKDEDKDLFPLLEVSFFSTVTGCVILSNSLTVALSASVVWIQVLWDYSCIENITNNMYSLSTSLSACPL